MRTAAEYAEAEGPYAAAEDAGDDGLSQAGLFLGLLAATLGGMGACYLILWRPLLSAWH
jgi:hypothetical protein